MKKRSFFQRKWIGLYPQLPLTLLDRFPKKKFKRNSKKEKKTRDNFPKSLKNIPHRLVLFEFLRSNFRDRVIALDYKKIYLYAVK